MEPLQILIILFATFFVSRVILRFKDKKVSYKELIFWVAFCAALIVASIQPQILNWLTQYSGSSRPIDIVVYISVILLFYLVFRLYVWFHGLEHNITTIIREMAKNGKKKK